jgi:hypothetical protein
MTEIMDPLQRLHPFGLYRAQFYPQSGCRRLPRYMNSRIFFPASNWVAVHRYAGPDR